MSLVRRLVVFSGFGTRVIEPVRQALASRQTDLVFAVLPAELNGQYFNQLLERIVKILAANPEERVKYVGLVASCVPNGPELSLERASFFPAFRRLAFPRAFARDLGRARQITDTILRTLTAPEFMAAARHLRPSVEARLLLPLLNVSAPKLKREVGELYDLRAFEPTTGLEKEAVRLKGGRGLRIKGIDFRATTNDPKHPIRRCTDNHACDVAARLRLGFSVPERFEFDVSCESGLEGKTFYLCDGTEQRVRSVSHLNMRINNDFRPGS